MNATEKENAYYAEKYQFSNNNVDWVDQYDNWIRYACPCGHKTVPMFDVTHKMYMTQCRGCYKKYTQTTQA